MWIWVYIINKNKKRQRVLHSLTCHFRSLSLSVGLFLLKLLQCWKPEIGLPSTGWTENHSDFAVGFMINIFKINDQNQSRRQWNIQTLLLGGSFIGFLHVFTGLGRCYFWQTALISWVFNQFPSTVDEGGGDRNADPDWGPQSVCPSQHRPQWGAAEEEQSESSSFLSVSMRVVSITVVYINNWSRSRKLLWHQDEKGKYLSWLQWTEIKNKQRTKIIPIL